MLSKLIPLTPLRGSSSINYLRTDPVRANPGARNVPTQQQ